MTFLEPNEDKMSVEELKRQFKVIDMMLTMHSALRDQNHVRAVIMDILLLCSSVVLCTTVFLDFGILSFIKINPQWARITIGVSSVVVFMISLFSFRVDWKQKSEKHNQASETLSRLKSDCRELLVSDEQPDAPSVQRQIQVNNLTLASLPKIPENKFNHLKAFHYRKVELSKMIETHPGSSLFLLRFRLWAEANFSLFRESPPVTKEEENE